MFLFETEKGDKWVCIHCVQEQEELIKEKNGNTFLKTMIRHCDVHCVDTENLITKTKEKGGGAPPSFKISNWLLADLS